MENYKDKFYNYLLFFKKVNPLEKKFKTRIGYIVKAIEKEFKLNYDVSSINWHFIDTFVANYDSLYSSLNINENWPLKEESITLGIIDSNIAKFDIPNGVIILNECEVRLFYQDDGNIENYDGMFNMFLTFPLRWLWEEGFKKELHNGRKAYLDEQQISKKREESEAVKKANLIKSAKSKLTADELAALNKDFL